jgi:hypothetical protein
MTPFHALLKGKLNPEAAAWIDEQLHYCGTHGDYCSHCASLQAVVEEIWTVVKAALA